MERLLARAQAAKAAAARKLAQRQATARRHRTQMMRFEHINYQNAAAAERRESRAQEKEDARLGPLAPKRAVGAKEMEEFGAIAGWRSQRPQLPREMMPERTTWNIVPRDRVVVLAGPDRHRVGVVKSTDRASGSVIVEGLNMAPIKMPEAYKTVSPNDPSVLHRELPLPYSSVRLVYPLRDPATGAVRDTIIANLESTPAIYDRRNRRTVWKRLVAGTTTVIPWPEPEPQKEQVDQPADTRIMDVETVTYVPELLAAPFPDGVIDELRNKYSKYRVRHEPEFVEMVEKSERERVRKEKELAGVRTPLKEYRAKERKGRKEKGWPEIGEDTLENIGRVMARNRPDLLAGVGAAASATASATA